MGKSVGKIFNTISGAIFGESGKSTINLPDPAAAAIPEDATQKETAEVKIGAESAEERARRMSSSRRTISSLGGSASSGINI